jgi:pyrroline-5-carboxylate reductase
MGGALLRGWLAGSVAQTFSRIDVVRPSVPSADLQLGEVTFHHALEEIDHTPDIVVWGVKPAQMKEVVSKSVEQFKTHPVYVSIAAGRTLQVLTGYAGADVKIIRSMPNTPVSIGEGVTGLCALQNVSGAEKNLVHDLFASVGKAVWIDENQMNALTALCGSGPAYVFYFMECLAQAAAKLGLDAEDTDRLTRQMVKGAAGLASQSKESLEQLRKNVTSPGGTTEAALEVWMREGTLDAQSLEALETAIKRAVDMES